MNCFLSVGCRLGYIVSIYSSHLFHTVKCTDLFRNFFSESYNVVSHSAVAAVCEILFLLFDKVIYTVKCYTAVVAYYSSSAIGIRKTCNDLIVSDRFHFRSVSVKNALIMSCNIFCKYFMKIRIGCEAICCACLFCHFYSTERHKCSLQRTICLNTYNFFKFRFFRIDVSGTICCQTRYYFCFHIKYSAVCSFFFLKFLNFIPECFCCICGIFKKRFISVIGMVVFLNKIPDIYFFFPNSSLEAIPCFSISYIH